MPEKQNIQIIIHILIVYSNSIFTCTICIYSTLYIMSIYCIHSIFIYSIFKCKIPGNIDGTPVTRHSSSSTKARRALLGADPDAGLATMEVLPEAVETLPEMTVCLQTFFFLRGLGRRMA